MRYQKGRVSLLALLGVMAVGFLLWAVIAVAPAVIEHQKLTALVERVQSDEKLATADKAKLYAWFTREFKNNDIWELDPHDVIEVSGSASKRRIELDYEARRPLFGPVVLLLDFSSKP